MLDARGFPLIVLEAKAEDKNPLVGKKQARKYGRFHARANSQGVKTERPDIREVPKSAFTKRTTPLEIYEALFKTA
jgi:type I site-specific restriction endonuclease